jgi:hypothetical protein
MSYIDKESKLMIDLFQFLSHSLVCYHIAPNLNAEEKRRLIGNDIAMIYYFDSTNEKCQFDLSGIDTFGEVPQVFTVIQPSPHNNFEFRFVIF